MQVVVLMVSVVGLTRKLKLVSDDENPDAVTPTVIPFGPAAGVIVILGVTVVTVNVARARSPVLPVTLIVCAPGAAVVETVKEALSWPLPEIEHEDNVTMSGNGILVTGTHEPASAGLNPLPVIVTPVPTVPEMGLRMIEGVKTAAVVVVVVIAEVPLVKEVEATSALAVTPVTVIVYKPSGGTEPTTNDPVTVPVVLTVHA
jgi:hypothetical protein